MPTKLEVSIPAHYEDMKRDRKFGKWDGLGSQRSLKVTENSAVRSSAYEFLLAFHSNLHRLTEI